MHALNASLHDDAPMRASGITELIDVLSCCHAAHAMEDPDSTLDELEADAPRSPSLLRFKATALVYGERIALAMAAFLIPCLGLAASFYDSNKALPDRETCGCTCWDGMFKGWHRPRGGVAHEGLSCDRPLGDHHHPGGDENRSCSHQ